ncbi:hypothetical protein [Candidatus Nitrosocosmicus hydrocola]|uniref:hypothetical protein n=1 Tax=Candidatus Nitrosocosmicus hydrocola TaxID=1826872 RepID=UPI0011E5CEAB|nr:hypothetical protein [Candidatus Nitrosocosmicus hydrocola]
MSPVSRGSKNMTTMEITLENAEKVKRKATLDHRNISETINIILNEYFDKLDFIDDLFPYLEIDYVGKENAVIKDRSQKKLVDLEFNGEHLTCLDDSSVDCEHTKFLWMSFQISKIKPDGKKIDS